MRCVWPLICIFAAGCDVVGARSTGRAVGVDAAATAADQVGRRADQAIEAEADLRPADASGPQRTIAGLGDPSKPGLWLETPLVGQETQGQVRVISTGATAQVTLVPVSGARTAGSHLSLSAMRALNAPLGDLIELNVTIGG